MDPSEPGERCLPGMGLSGWMKKTMERSYDLSDFCNSPPADGFFYPAVGKGNNAGVAGKGSCSEKKDEIRSCTVMGGVLSINQPISQQLNQSMMGNDASLHQFGDQYHNNARVNNMALGCNAITTDASSVPGYMKPIMTGFGPATFSKQMSRGFSQTMMESTANAENTQINQQQLSSEEMRNWANSDRNMEQACYRMTEQSEINRSHPTDDSAPSPVDHHIISNRSTPSTIVTHADEAGTSRRFVDKLGAGNISVPATPDVTPCTTPAVTPACSPQVARRTGNPFFTGGGDDDNKSGSWLFRPGKKAGDRDIQSEKHYETKVEFQQQPNSKIAKKTVRYVPRPSELRELNFWSPTSM